MSSGFVTETELAEARQQRQEEWEKVRTAEQPLERPEEPYDSRSLFDRLKEQRDKKDLEFEETHKLKNLVRGLDDDEVDFLDIVDKAKMDAERRQQIEEKNELRDFRQRVATLQENSIDQKISTEKVIPKPNTTTTSTRPTQKSILAGIVRKRQANESAIVTTNVSDIPNKKSKIAEIGESAATEVLGANGNASIVSSTGTTSDSSASDQGALKCIGILPGIGKYDDSSDSERTTDTDDEFDYSEFDWLGRKIKKGDDCNE